MVCLEIIEKLQKVITVHFWLLAFSVIMQYLETKIPNKLRTFDWSYNFSFQHFFQERPLREFTPKNDHKMRIFIP